jgi:hypothetical protein
VTSASDQVPRRGQAVLDHVGLFVPDMHAAAAALERWGFIVTPFSVQSHALGPGEPVVPAGTANRMAMLGRGYLEMLTPIDYTPIAAQLRNAIARHTGMHLIAFGSGDADADHAHLARSGFAPVPVVRLQRSIEVAGGQDTARFGVVRVPPGTMAEGRVQYCQHLTAHLVWQARWLDHPNRVDGLSDALLCVDDPDEAAARFARFVGRIATPLGRGGRLLTLERGRLAFFTRDELTRRMPRVAVPELPFMAAVAMSSRDLPATRAWLNESECAFQDSSDGAITLHAPAALGVTLAITARDGRPPWLAD